MHYHTSNNFRFFYNLIQRYFRMVAILVIPPIAKKNAIKYLKKVCAELIICKLYSIDCELFFALKEH